MIIFMSNERLQLKVITNEHITCTSAGIIIETSLKDTYIRVSTIPDKTREGHDVSSPPAPTLNVDNQVILFPFLLEKTRYFPPLIRGDGGYVIQLRCPNHFWPGLQVV